MKRIGVLMLALALMLPLCACAAGRSAGAGEPAAAGSATAALSETEAAEALLDPTEQVYHNDYEAYLGMLDGMYRQGEYFARMGLGRQAAYLYDAGGAAAGALRYCMECVLFLKGEGESLDDVVMGRFADWDSLARLSPASPYPDYFEGLVYQMQGNKEKATEYFLRALTFPSWPEAGWDFTYLKMLEPDELYALRDALLATEHAFYKASRPELIPVGRDLYNFSSAYLIARAGEALAAGDHALAADYAASAVRADPFDGNAYAAAALTGMAVGSDTAAGYLNDGLYIAPTHEGLNALLHAFEGGDAQ